MPVLCLSESARRLICEHPVATIEEANLILRNRKGVTGIPSSNTIRAKSIRCARVQFVGYVGDAVRHVLYVDNIIRHALRDGCVRG
jgi:hypothetical protein